MFTRLHQIFLGLIDGTAPLPAPFPQKLNFTKHPNIVRGLAARVSACLEEERLQLTDEELKHLLFKIAKYVTRAGGNDRAVPVQLQIARIWPSIAMTLRTNPEWLTSKAGVQWAIENCANRSAALAKRSRADFVEPPRVAELEWYPGYFLVELTNAAHVHAEGVALGHCMSWSVNSDALLKHGHPAPDSAEALECLTYAVKIRHRELRIFSLRGSENQPLMTLTYSNAGRCLEELRGARYVYYPSGWSISHCALHKALSSIVELNLSDHSQWGGCLRRCPGEGWCETVMPSRGDPAFTFFRS